MKLKRKWVDRKMKHFIFCMLIFTGEDNKNIFKLGKTNSFGKTLLFYDSVKEEKKRYLESLPPFGK